MSPTHNAPMSGSLRAARTAVEIVWYLTWGLTVVATLASIVFAVAPGTRTALVTRGALTEQVTETLPFKVRYDASDSVLARAINRRAWRSASARRMRPMVTGSDAGPVPRLMGHNDVVLAREMTAGLLGGAILSALLTGGLLLWTLHQLRMLVRTVSRGAPFDPANPARIRRIGWIVLAYGPLSGLLVSRRERRLAHRRLGGGQASVSGRIGGCQPGPESRHGRCRADHPRHCRGVRSRGASPAGAGPHRLRISSVLIPARRRVQHGTGRTIDDQSAAVRQRRLAPEVVHECGFRLSAPEGA